MWRSWRLARNSLGGKRGRTLLIIGAVTLAASLVSAVSGTVRSIQASMERGLTNLLGSTDARLIHQFNGRFDEAILDDIRSWPEVDVAMGQLVASLTLVRQDGRIDPETGRVFRLTPTAVGTEWDLQSRFREVRLREGELPATPTELLIDPRTADKLDAVVGDVLVVQRFGAPIELTVSGIYEVERLGAVQRPLVRIDRRTLGEAVGRASQLTRSLILLKDGADLAAFCDVHSEGLDESLALEPAEMFRTGFDRRVMASRYGLIIASVVTFLAASFIIVTGLTTAVTEKQRELAMIRCIGGSRAQLAGSQVLVGLFVGGVGGILGVPLGIGLAGILVWWFREELPAGLHIHPLGIQLALIGSIIAGIGGALYPAWMASRVAPLTAMASRSRPATTASIVMAAVIGLSCIGIHLLLLASGDEQNRFWTYAYVGAPLVNIGYFILAVPILVLVTRTMSSIISMLLGLPRDVLRGTVMATPFRHGFTAGALMVGMSILVSTWSNATSLLDDWVGRIQFADGFAHRTTGISPRQQEAIDELPFVEATCPIGYLPVKVIGQQIFGVDGLSPPNIICVGFDPEVFFEINAIEWIQGDQAVGTERLKEGDAIIVAERFLTARDVGVGDTLTLGAGRVERDFEIVGVVSAGGLEIVTHLFGIRSQYLDYAISCVFMDFDAVVEHFDNSDAYMLQINLVDDVDDDAAKAAIEEAAPGVLFHSGRWVMQTINEIAFALLTVQSAIAFAALILACLSVGNVLIASIHGRRYEYGVMRAVGAQRGLLLRLIMGEAAIIAVSGIIVGTALGLHLAWVTNMNYRDLAGINLSLAFPLVPALIGCAVLLSMTLLAALPGALGVTRCEPSALLASGGND